MKTYFAVLETNSTFRLLVADDDPDLREVVGRAPWRLCDENEAVNLYRDAAAVFTVFLLDTHITHSEFSDKPVLDWLSDTAVATDTAKKRLLIMYSGEPFENDLFFRAFAKSGHAARDMDNVINLVNLTVADEIDLQAWPHDLRGSPSDHLEALCLLCEAWLLSNWGESHDFARLDELIGELGFKSPADTESCAGILLSAPKALADWLKPFGDECTVETLVAKVAPNQLKRPIQNFFTSLNTGGIDFAAVADLFLALSRHEKDGRS